MSGVVADTSEWIEFFAGRPAAALISALRQGTAVIPPVVVAELVSGAAHQAGCSAIESLLPMLMLHDTPLDHWIRVGELRRKLRGKGVSVSTPDAHVAQCAIDLDATLLARDSIFAQVARHTSLRFQHEH